MVLQVFADYKTRGPVILKPSDTAELIEKLEDSQMQLGSMATNRYYPCLHISPCLPGLVRFAMLARLLCQLLSQRDAAAESLKTQWALPQHCHGACVL